MSNRRERITSYEDLVSYRKALQIEDEANSFLLKKKVHQKNIELRSKIKDLIVPVSILLGGALVSKLFESDESDEERKMKASTNQSTNNASLETWIKLAKVVTPLITTVLASNRQEQQA